MCCILLQKRECCCLNLRDAQLLVAILNIFFSLIVLLNVWLTMQSAQSHYGTETLLHVLIVLFLVNGICAFISWFSKTIGAAAILFILTLILTGVIITTNALLINIFVHDQTFYNNLAMLCGFSYGVVGLYSYAAVHSYFREISDTEVSTNTSPV